MQSNVVTPEFPLAGLVLLGLLALVAAVLWWRAPAARARWQGWARQIGETGSPAPKVRAQRRLDAVHMLYDLEWGHGRRLLVCTARGAAPVVLDRILEVDAGEGQESQGGGESLSKQGPPSVADAKESA